MNEKRQLHHVLTKILTILIALATVSSPSYSQRPATPAINLSYLRVDFAQPGAVPAGLGGAYIGAAQDALATIINPGGLTYFDKLEVSLNHRITSLQFDELVGSPDNPNGSRTFTQFDFNQSAVASAIPFRIFKPLQGKWPEKLTLAIHRHVAFDTRFDFQTPQFPLPDIPLDSRRPLQGPGNVAGRDVALDLQMVNNGMSLAYPITNTLSIGGTGKIAVLDFRLSEKNYRDPALTQENRMNVQPRRSAETLYSIAEIDEQLTKLGYSFGLMAKLIPDRLFLGAVYNINPTYRLQSDTFLPSYSSGQESYPAQAVLDTFSLNVPDTYGAGIYYRITERIALTADVSRILYNQILSDNSGNWPNDDTLSTGASQHFVDPSGQDFNIDNATEFHVGLEIFAKMPKLGFMPFRFGLFNKSVSRVYWDDSGSPDLSPLFPKAKDYLHFSFGIGVAIAGLLNFDGAAIVWEKGYALIGSALLKIDF